MGDVSILIKNGRVIDLSKNKDNNKNKTDTNDNEDEDDIDEDELSGSGSTGLPSTPDVLPPETTSTPVKQQVSSEGGDGTNIAIIAAAVSCAVIVLVIIIVLIVCLRRRRRRRREKSNSLKPLPHPASMDMSESSRTTLAVRPTGDGYYAPSAPIYKPSGAACDEFPPPIEPPPPPPTSKKSLNQSKPGKSARYTKLNTAPGGKETSENIYETIDDFAVGEPDDGEVYLVGVGSNAEGGKGDDDDDYPYEETDKIKC